jgi:hypothetical protein
MSNQTENNRPSVIVQGWGNEPVKLFLHSIENDICYVGNGSTKRPVGLPSNQVFVFSEGLFSRLREEYDFHNWTVLSTLYETISVDDFACNKYRNKVLSSHDQEGIADTECIAVSDRQ